MATTNFKPEFTIFKTESDAFNSITENRDLIRKNDIRRLHGNRTDAAPFTPERKRRKTVLPVVSFIHGWTVDTFLLAASGSQMQALSTGCLSKSG